MAADLDIPSLCRLVWWKFRNVSITPDRLRTVATAAGVDPASVPDINKRSALKAAVRQFSVRKGKERVFEAVVASDNGGEVHINLLKLERQSAKKVAKLPVDSVVWQEGVGFTDSGATGEAITLIKHIEHKQHYYDGNAVRAHVVAPVLEECSSFSLTRGMYVVMEQDAGPLDKLTDALAGVENFKLNTGRVLGGSGFEEPIADAARESMTDELEELRQQIDGWREMARSVRSDTQSRVMERFQVLRDRAAVYARTLKVAFGDLVTEVEEMEKVANGIISERSSAPAYDPAEHLRRALAGMPVAQLKSVYEAFCGELEEGITQGEMVEAVAKAREDMEAAG